ncbi:Cytochrome c-552 [Rhodovastum atsumiense]|nr:Cytochrome c-552 [Rhodovastum atsumiense]
MRSSAIFVAALAMSAVPAAAQQSGDPATGREIAQAWCSECHMIESRQARGNDAVPSFPAIAARSDTTSMGLHAFLATPHANMPNLRLSRAEMDNLVAYILSLRH